MARSMGGGRVGGSFGGARVYVHSYGTSMRYASGSRNSSTTTGEDCAGMIICTVMILFLTGVIICVCIGGNTWTEDNLLIAASQGDPTNCTVESITAPYDKAGACAVDITYFLNVCGDKYLLWQTVPCDSFGPDETPIDSDITCYTTEPSNCNGIAVVYPVDNVSLAALLLVVIPLSLCGLFLLLIGLLCVMPQIREYIERKTECCWKDKDAGPETPDTNTTETALAV